MRKVSELLAVYPLCLASFKKARYVESLKSERLPSGAVEGLWYGVNGDIMRSRGFFPERKGPIKFHCLRAKLSPPLRGRPPKVEGQSVNEGGLAGLCSNFIIGSSKSKATLQ